MTSQTTFHSSQPGAEFQPAFQPVEMRMILLAGADPAAMQDASMELFRAGHMPLMGEWFAEPLAAVSGLNDADHEAIDPLGERLLSRCDAVLRLGGESASGDAMVAVARARGLRVFFSLEDALEG
jgi:hypothetical protein